MQPFASVDEAWAALEAQRGMNDGEPVDLWQHALQTAEGLEQQGADDELVAAGLLHDLGDGRVSEAAHAGWAAALVEPLFGPRVAALVRNHAEAKRYLCATDPSYWARLSPTSRRTLIAQGGVMTAAEAGAFGRQPWAHDATWLRRCDDAGKRVDHEVAQPERFRMVLERVAAARHQ